MASALSKDTLVRILLRKEPEQRAAIQTDAEAVALGATNSISSLSQSVSYSIPDAAVILDALETVTSMLEADAGATVADLAGSSLGHAFRFQPVASPAGMTWGP